MQATAAIGVDVAEGVFPSPLKSTAIPEARTASPYASAGAAEASIVSWPKGALDPSFPRATPPATRSAPTHATPTKHAEGVAPGPTCSAAYHTGLGTTNPLKATNASQTLPGKAQASTRLVAKRTGAFPTKGVTATKLAAA